MQAIDSGIDDLRFQGTRVAADISGAITGAPTLKRTIAGVSSIGMTLNDPDRKLLTSSFLGQRSRCDVDGLNFTLGQVKWKDGVIPIRLKDSAVVRLEQFKGPKKAYRDKVTRAQFIGSLFREAGVPFVSPERFIEQPIEKTRRSSRGRQKSDENRAPGFGPNPNITVKGVKASRSQIEMAEIILTVGIQEGANFRELSMGIACATQENNLSNNNPGDAAGPDSRGLFGQRLQYYPNAEDPVAASRYFFSSSISEPGGMIGFNRRNPDMNFSLAIAAVQKPAAEYRMEYQKHKEEAHNTVREFLGGEGTSTFQVTETERYAYFVKKDENYWQAAVRLAQEVRWRLFVTAGVGYFMTDERLLGSRPRMTLTGDYEGTGGINYPPGVISMSFDITEGKPTSSMQLEVVAGKWTVPPGAVAIAANDLGPAKGRWLVHTITKVFGSKTASVKLVRPMKPLPEPAPETNTRSVTVGGAAGNGSSAGSQRAVTWAKNQVGVAQGSSKYNGWMEAVGGYDPWCSFWIGYLMREVCGLECSDFGHSDYWSSWSGAKRVSVSNLEPGDIVGYSGTHVALHIGGGRCISGNYGDKVAEHGLNDPSAAVSYAVRPKYRG